MTYVQVTLEELPRNVHEKSALRTVASTSYCNTYNPWQWMHVRMLKSNIPELKYNFP